MLHKEFVFVDVFLKKKRDKGSSKSALKQKTSVCMCVRVCALSGDGQGLLCIRGGLKMTVKLYKVRRWAIRSVRTVEHRQVYDHAKRGVAQRQPDWSFKLTINGVST